MPHISKIKLKRESLAVIYDQLIKAVVNAKDSKGAQLLMKEFFTQTERIMLAKRLALIILLMKGYSEYKIWNTLKMSSSTIARLRIRVNKGDFSSIKSIFTITKNKSSQSFFDNLEKFLLMGMPPRVGGNRYSFLNRLDKNAREHKLNQKILSIK